VSGDVRLGLVGCGRLAEHGYVPAARLAAGVRIVAVADPHPARRESVARLAGATSAHPDAAALLTAGEVDAIVLASPADRHLPDAEQAVAAGVAVLVEKPPAPDLAGTRALAALEGTVHVGFNRRFDRDVAALRSRLPVGEPLDLRLRLAYRRASWGAHAVRDDVVLDLVPHLVDRARWLLGGEVRTVAAHLGPDRATLTLGLDRGRAVAEAAADQVHEEVVEVRDARGALVATHRRGGPVAAVTDRARAAVAGLRGTPAPHPLAASLAAQLEAFAGAVRGRPPGELATAADGVAAMAVVDAARASADAGGAPVPVPQEHPTC